MKHFLIGRNGDCLSCINHPFNIGFHYLPVPDCDNAVRIHTADVAAGNSGIHRMNLTAGHEFSLFNRALNRLNRRLNVDYSAFLETTGFMASYSDNIQTAIGIDIAHNRHHL